MNAIIDFFTSCIDVLASLIGLVVTMVESIIWLTGNIPQLVAGVTAGFAYAPTFLMPFLSGSVALLVAFAIIRML